MLALMRVKQWTKNLFVFVGLIFAHRIHESELVARVVMATIAFCLVSSAVYVLNDLVDQDRDRKHPTKRFRPIASGEVSFRMAGGLLGLLAFAGLALAYAVGPYVFALIASYVLLNLFYSFYAKSVVILDVFCIAIGFMIRLFVGTVGVGIPPSPWLFICGLLVTLFLGFAKRRAEFQIMADAIDEGGTRRTLSQYTAVFLDQALGVTASGTILAYSLYTRSPETIQTHGSDHLMATIPFVVYGLLRYMFLIYTAEIGENPSVDLFRDRHLIFAILGWLVATIAIIS